jgi:hypothetical protein
MWQKDSSNIRPVMITLSSPFNFLYGQSDGPSRSPLQLRRAHSTTSVSTLRAKEKNHGCTSAPPRIVPIKGPKVLPIIAKKYVLVEPEGVGTVAPVSSLVETLSSRRGVGTMRDSVRRVDSAGSSTLCTSTTTTRRPPNLPVQSEACTSTKYGQTTFQFSATPGLKPFDCEPCHEYQIQETPISKFVQPMGKFQARSTWPQYRHDGYWEWNVSKLSGTCICVDQIMLERTRVSAGLSKCFKCSKLIEPVSHVVAYQQAS